MPKNQNVLSKVKNDIDLKEQMIFNKVRKSCEQALLTDFIALLYNRIVKHMELNIKEGKDYQFCGVVAYFDDSMVTIPKCVRKIYRCPWLMKSTQYEVII